MQPPVGMPLSVTDDDRQPRPLLVWPRTLCNKAWSVISNATDKCKKSFAVTFQLMANTFNITSVMF